mgnify:CR=1 FL=1
MTKGDGFALAAAFIGGAVAGAAIGLLFAPEKGEDQRAKIKAALEKRGVKMDKERAICLNRFVLTNLSMRLRIWERRKKLFQLKILMRNSLLPSFYTLMT